MSDSTHMNMGVFHWGDAGDGLWLTSWVPQSEGAYIAACFGLFLISILSRSLPAMEAYFIVWKRLRDERLDGNKVYSPNTTLKSDIEHSSDAFDSSAYPTSPRLPIVPAFSWSTDTIRSFLTTVSSFVSYLLMMVVMTGNGGFLLVIVVGIFFGEMAFGRFKALNVYVDDHAH